METIDHIEDIFNHLQQHVFKANHRGKDCYIKLPTGSQIRNFTLKDGQNYLSDFEEDIG